MCQLGTTYQGEDASRDLVYQPSFVSQQGRMDPGSLPWMGFSQPFWSRSTSEHWPQENTARQQASIEWGGSRTERQYAAQPGTWVGVWQAGPSPCLLASFARLLLHGVKKTSPFFPPAHDQRSHSHILLRHSLHWYFHGKQETPGGSFPWVGWSCGQQCKGDSGTQKQIPGWVRNGLYEEQSWTATLIELETL